LREEFVHQRRPEIFERLKVFLLGRSEAPYAALLANEPSAGAIKVFTGFPGGIVTSLASKSQALSPILPKRGRTAVSGGGAHEEVVTAPPSEFSVVEVPCGKRFSEGEKGLSIMFHITGSSLVT
jgi:hypothetical protein